MTYPIIKFFKTFAADVYPIEPRDEIGWDEAQSLITYYGALYDDANRLREFRKYLRQSDANNNPTWTVAFVERYDYWQSGRLKTRSLVGPDGTTRSWRFSDRAFGRLHLRKWFESWYESSDRPTVALGLSERVIGCHERANQIVADLFGDTSRQRDSVWAFGTIKGSLPDFKALFTLILPGANPRISFLGSKDSRGPKSLPGFDELLNLGVLNEAWNYLDRRETYTPVKLLSVVRQDADVRQWLQASQIAMAFALPIRAIVSISAEGGQGKKTAASRHAVTVGQLVLWLMIAPTEAEAAGIVSILQRLAVFVQIAISMATEQEPISFEQDVRTQD